MYDLDAIEAINIDQLVTATDRLLVIGPRNRATRRTQDLSRAAAAAVASSRARREAEEPTMFVRGRSRRVELVGAVALLTGAWLGVVSACLLA